MSIQFPDRFNMAEYFLYHNVEEGRENKVCLYFNDQTWTYGQTVKLSNRVGNALRELGVELEHRVLIILPDCPEFVGTWFGAARIGAVIVVGGDANYSEPERNSRVKWISFEKAILYVSEECIPADTHRDDIAIWLFTSGSTGHPKGAVHLQHDLPFNTEVFAKQTIGVLESDITVSVPKLFFGYATGTNLLFPFAVGAATALFSERSTPEKLFAVIERYRPTILTTVPTMINAMLNAPGSDPGYLSGLRFCYSAGEALPVELYERWMNTFGIKVYDGIGSAEMFHIYISNRP